LDGRWTGEWVRGPDGEALDRCCHYVLAGGIIHYCGDSSHHLAGEPFTGRDGIPTSFVGIATRRYWMQPTLGM
jgi:hypothetical protein